MLVQLRKVEKPGFSAVSEASEKGPVGVGPPGLPWKRGTRPAADGTSGVFYAGVPVALDLVF